jgi:hypothetical protein
MLLLGACHRRKPVLVAHSEIKLILICQEMRVMIRLISACVMGMSVAVLALPAQAQQAAQGSQAVAGQAAAASKGQNCKKTYVQKKSARTGKYVHVPRQRCE